MKLIILDRDGVINEDCNNFIKSPQEWIPIPGSLEAIARLNRANYRVVVATNQSGISHGLFDIITLNKIHEKMHCAAQQVGAKIDTIFFCVHKANDNCNCRKPKIGMFHEIAKRFKINLFNDIITVGDSLRDLQASFISGCITYLVLTGKGKKTQETGNLPPNTKIYSNLINIVNHLLTSSNSQILNL